MKALRQQAINEAEGIEGWMTVEELGFLFDSAEVMDSVVEVGCWKGRSTYVLAKACKGTVTAVDTFRGTANDAEHIRRVAAAGGSTLPQFSINVQKCPNVRVLQMESLEAATVHAPVDMVFIDGGHSYEQVVADLRAWKPKARKLICGHDWQFPSVQRAVREVLGQVDCSGEIWYQFFNPKQAPLFSILHTSARPDKWRAVYNDWISKAARPKDVEYVLVIDPRWGFSSDPAMYNDLPQGLRVVMNNRRRCYVDGVNLAAQACIGQILIVNADDQFACEAWDVSIRAALEPNGWGMFQWSKYGDSLATYQGEPWVMEISTGTPDEHQRAIMVMPILSRARYEQQGFVFFPEYESMYADNDFCEAARKDGVVIDARHLMFPHRHPMFRDGEWRTKAEGPGEVYDEAYKAQNRGEAYALGEEIFARRSAADFPPLARGEQHPRTIALCLSGEQFQGVWVDYIMTLQAHLIARGFNVMKLRCVNNIVHLMREEIRRALMNCEVRPDLCLWLDDDNVLSIEHFETLLADIDAFPEVDGVSGWCWIHNDKKQGFMVSCGEWAPDHLHWNPFAPSFRNEYRPRPFETGGFPVMLMRFSALEKAGDGCFLPIIDNRLEHGMSGEDMAFFLNAEKGGAKFLVDPRVKVPHLKYVEVEPVFPEEGKVPVKIACMIRAKNEARWIRRVIESVKTLCGENIYVMEDGSVDDTAEIARAVGAVVLESPFVGEGFQEVRDKNWLLGMVRAACAPDWILGIDGDEELEPGGCEKIRQTCESNPPIDSFSLRVLYLWDSVDQVRLDGLYEKISRQSLFRANSDLEFKSMYEGGGENHCGLHCSNAPGLGGLHQSPLNVFLLHYGYLHREDRIRKYEWILKLDPHNEAEDFYRHTVQGDVPEVPAGAKLKHAGPLVLSKLPARLVPDFDVVPGPFDPEGVF